MSGRRHHRRPDSSGPTGCCGADHRLRRASDGPRPLAKAKDAPEATRGDSGGKRNDGAEKKADTGGGKDADAPAKGWTCETDNSFTPGTPVLMADGSTKPIEDVKTGDKVLATDPETGETTTETVTAAIKGNGVKHLVELTVDTDGHAGEATDIITATDGHPFRVPELGEWVDATDLKSGQWLRTSAGTLVQITAVERWTSGSATVHNLTVDDAHTYYVLAGATPVLVHNCGVDADYGRVLSDGRRTGVTAIGATGEASVESPLADGCRGPTVTFARLSSRSTASPAAQRQSHWRAVRAPPVDSRWTDAFGRCVTG